MPRQLNITEKTAKLREFYRQEKRMPGYAEFMKIMGYGSKNAVFNLIKRLEEYGYIRRGRSGKISFTGKITGSIRMLGAIQAGFPTPAEEELADIINLDEFLIRRPEATFMLTVSGDSMLDAGIHPGDIVLVEKGGNPKSGSIVVAQVDGEWTMKYYVKEKGEVILEPANKKYKPIKPAQSLLIGGIVRAVIRKYE